MARNSKPMRIGVALSGGGARGLSHIGVIQELERLGIPVFCVAGTSMGSLVGGWYAAKRNVESFVRVFKQHPWRSFFRMTHVPRNLNEGGLFDMAEIEKELRVHLDNVKIEGLPVKFADAATSITTGKEVDFFEGDLVESILASGALPIVFLPRKHEGDYFIDGGVVNNLPADLCFKMGADAVIAVDVGFQLSDFNLVSDHGTVGFRPWEVYRIMNALINMVQISARKDAPQPEKNIFVLRPYVSHIDIAGFDRMDEAIYAGRKAVLDNEGELRDFLGLERPQKDFWQQVREFIQSE